DELTCTYEGYEDLDGDDDASTFSWSVDGVEVGTDETLSGVFVGGDEVICSVTPHDGEDAGEPVTDSLVISNTGPEVESVELTPDPATVEDTLVCTPGDITDVDGDTDFEVTTSWEVDGEDPGVTTETLSSPYFSRLDDVQCFVTPYDDEDAGERVASNVVIIANSVPSVDAVSIGPDPATADDTLTCTYEGYSDADGDGDDSIIEWSVDGVVIGTGETLSGGFVRGDEVVCTVTPSDGTDSGTAITASIVAGNALPAIDGVTLSPDPASVDDELVCEAGDLTDADGDDVTVITISWDVSGTDPGVLISTLDSDDFERGDEITCTMTPSDGIDLGESVTSNTVTIGNDVPSVGTVSISPDPATATDTLTCSYDGFDDGDGDSDESIVIWEVDGVTVASGETLESGYPGGTIITCTVTPYDGEDYGEPVSVTLIMDNSAPSIESVSISPEPAYAGDTLLCTYDGFADPDGDEDHSTLEWTVNGVEEGIDPSLSIDFGDGDEVTCTVTPSDGLADGVPVSVTVIIQKSPPVVDSVELSPEELYTDTTVVATPVTSHEGGEELTYTYIWYVDDEVVLEGEGEDTLDGDLYFDKGQELWVNVTPWAEGSAGIDEDSGVLIVLNTPPGAPVVAIDPADPAAYDDLECGVSEDSYDADGDEITYTVVWEVDGTEYEASDNIASGWITLTDNPISGTIELIIGGYSVSISPSFSLEATAAELIFAINDDPDVGDLVEASGPYEEHDQALILLVSLLPGSQGNETDLSVEDEGTGGDISCEESLSGGVDADVVPSADTSSGEVWTCTLTPWDGEDDGDSASDSVTISEDCDEDGDGYDAEVCGGEDCDDEDDSVSPSVEEVCNDRIDNDCDGTANECELSGTVDLEAADAMLWGTIQWDYAGRSIAAGGLDVNGDGYDDVLLGAPGEDSTATDAGAAYLVLGPISGTTSLSAAEGVLYGEEEESQAGWSVGGGDLDGDGYDDLVVGAPYASDGADGGGVVYLLDGPVSGSLDLATEASLLVGEYDEAWTGASLSVGEMDGDGVADLVVGAEGFVEDGTAVGGAYMVHGPITGDLDFGDVDGKVIGEEEGDQAGYAVATGGDLEGDGHQDILVGAPGEDTTDADAGAAYVVRGPVTGPMQLRFSTAILFGSAAGDAAGSSVSFVGDTNDDGYADVLVGATGVDDTGSRHGAAYLMLGPLSTDMDLSGADAVLTGESDGDRAGYTVAGGTDLDDDEYADLLVGAYGLDTGGDEAGGVYVLLGPVTGAVPLSEADAILSGSGSTWRAHVGAAGGDMDGDGYQDILVGAWLGDGDESQAGAVHLFRGLGL
ncbi:MAG: FG-GAP-like repeat-containing protein, partial [Myxococcota bacterium]|nr:FG-GAP-like repeat-containing protein [Myxococcota bacterium]